MPQAMQELGNQMHRSASQFAIELQNASATGADAQPTAFTLTDFYAANVRAYPGIQITDFSLKFTAEGLLDYDAKGMGW
jgi:hypothetical protein